MKSNSKFNLAFYFFYVILFIYSLFLLIHSNELTNEMVPPDSEMILYVGTRILAGLSFFIAAYFLPRISLNFKIIFAIGVAARLLLIPTTPVMEDDFNRYLWDGAVTAHGINPFRYSPKEIGKIEDADDRDTLLKLSEDAGNYYSRINHPHIRTIYPPPAQAVFAIGYLISPFSLTVWKLILFLFDIVSLLLIMKILAINRIDRKYSVIYWLNPILLHEFFNAAHMDLLIFPFLLSGIYFYQSNRIRNGMLLNSIAASIKIWPVVLIPLFFRNSLAKAKNYFTYLIPSFIVLLILFSPLLFTTWDDSLGFVKYSGAWVNNEAIFKIFHLIVSGIKDLLGLHWISSAIVTRLFTILLYLFFAVLILKEKIRDNSDFNKRALLLVALFYMISPTQFPWYYTWILPLLVFYPMLSIMLYAALLPLYQLNYLSPYLIWVQHIPILILFILELRGKIWNGWKVNKKFS